MPSRLNPYLSFDGKAREAMDFYHDVFGGEMTAQTFAEGGMSQGPDDANLIQANIEFTRSSGKPGFTKGN